MSPENWILCLSLPIHPLPPQDALWHPGIPQIARYVGLKAEPNVAVAPHGDILLLGLIGVPWIAESQANQMSASGHQIRFLLV